MNTTLPSTVTKTEEPRYDTYTGPLEDLIAAGLVRRDQLPPPGRPVIAWRHGIHQPRRCPQDEHYLRVVLNRNDIVTVQIGVTAEVARPRVTAEVARPRVIAARIKEQKARAERAAIWEAKEEARMRKVEAKKRAEEADNAKKTLDQIPSSERAFLRYEIGHIRSMADIFLKRLDEPATWHGYRVSTETKEAAIVAIDAIVEALMQGEVIFDAEWHAKVVAGYKATIRAADPAFYDQLDKLTTPNPSILEGEAS